MSFTGCTTADSQWLFIALGEHDEPASIAICADDDELLAAIKETMFDTGDGQPLSEDHAAEAQAVMESLLEDGEHHFEGDPAFHLYRVWKSREQAIADVRSVPTDVAQVHAVASWLKAARGLVSHWKAHGPIEARWGNDAAQLLAMAPELFGADGAAAESAPDRLTTAIAAMEAALEPFNLSPVQRGLWRGFLERINAHGVNSNEGKSK